MSWSENTSLIQIGDEVYGSDGDKVGNVAEVKGGYIVVEKGFFFPTDYYIPVSAITSASNGQVVLNVSRDIALNSGWDSVPEATTNDAIMTGDRGWDLASEVTATDRILGEDAGGTSANLPRQAAYEATSQDELVIPLREEELSATVRETEAGAARIEKRVVTEDRVLEVPVTEEQIRVERRVVDRAAGADDKDAFEEIVIEVPLTAEQVELRKQSRVAEEVVVSKEAIQHTEQVRGTVRREEVEVIDDAGRTNAIDDTDARA